ncbi:flavin monoamine oxidase family protein, partial [Acidisphaera rubrifaciens]|uniref:flavin monoamine oxidase family protein n=1 Tax=Acidisphaera rubrifaciens TaxID=50715 RepID=UPI00066251EB
EHAWAAYDAAGARLAAAPGPDTSMAAVADALEAAARPDGATADGETVAWLPMIEAWEGPVICAAEARGISLRDWHANALEGRNLTFPGGLGDFVARRLGPGAGDIRLGTPATAIAWSGHGVTVTTPMGPIEGCAAIVTVSTAVLAREAIRFTPALPAHVLQAASDLPLGLALKVALRAAGPDRLGLPPFTTLDRQIATRGEAFAIFNVWPYGRDHAIAWVGGDTAWTLARAGARAAQDFALAEIKHMLGSRAAALFTDEVIVTGWDRDPLIGGVYSNARPGAADARRVLAAPLADGRLVFAGEACHVGFAGTVAGAWHSGERAARHVAAALTPGSLSPPVTPPP